MYDIHRLVPLTMLNSLNQQGELEEWTAKVVEHVEDAFPVSAHDNRGIWMSYLAHARQLLERQKVEEDVKTNLAAKVGCSLELLCQYYEAETMYRRALAGQEKVLGRHHLYTLTTVNNLAVTFRNQGR